MVDLNYCGVFSLVSISCMVVWTHCSKKSPKIQVLKAIQFPMSFASVTAKIFGFEPRTTNPRSLERYL